MDKTEQDIKENWHLYSTYWDYVFLFGCPKCEPDTNKRRNKFFALRFPINTYIFECGWDLKYYILCPTELDEEILKTWNIKEELNDYVSPEKFKQIADYVVTSEEKEKYFKAD